MNMDGLRRRLDNLEKRGVGTLIVMFDADTTTPEEIAEYEKNNPKAIVLVFEDV